MFTDVDQQELADSRRFQLRAGLSHARAWIEADTIQPAERTDAVMKPPGPTPRRSKPPTIREGAK